MSRRAQYPAGRFVDKISMDILRKKGYDSKSFRDFLPRKGMISYEKTCKRRRSLLLQASPLRHPEPDALYRDRQCHRLGVQPDGHDEHADVPFELFPLAYPARPGLAPVHLRHDAAHDRLSRPDRVLLLLLHRQHHRTPMGQREIHDLFPQRAGTDRRLRLRDLLDPGQRA